MSCAKRPQPELQQCQYITAIISKTEQAWAPSNEIVVKSNHRVIVVCTERTGISEPEKREEIGNEDTERYRSLAKAV